MIFSFLEVFLEKLFLPLSHPIFPPPPTLASYIYVTLKVMKSATPSFPRNVSDSRWDLLLPADQSLYLRFSFVFPLRETEKPRFRPRFLSFPFLLLRQRTPTTSSVTFSVEVIPPASGNTFPDRENTLILVLHSPLPFLLLPHLWQRPYPLHANPPPFRKQKLFFRNFYCPPKPTAYLESLIFHEDGNACCTLFSPFPPPPSRRKVCLPI